MGVTISAATLTALAAELGLDAVGAAPAAPYARAEAAIADRRARGLLDTMGFTTRRPEVSCHPELLVPGARSVVAAALAVPTGPLPPLAPGEGRLPRYTWTDSYGDLRRRLEQLGESLGGSWRVLVDENDHVDREAAARAGVGFYGKNTMLIAPGLGTWIVLGALVTTAEVEAAAPLRDGCGSCTLCIDACPTGALDEPYAVDATRCLSWLSQRRAAIPEEHRAALGAMVYGCDICQDVCPWNRGPEKRGEGDAAAPGPPPPPAEDSVVSLIDWLRADPAELRARYPRLYVQRNDLGVLPRNAAVVLGNTGTTDHESLLDVVAAGLDDASRVIPDPEGLVAEHAAWAAARLRERL